MMNWLLKQLLCKHEDPILIPGAPFQQARCVIHACHPSTGEAETNRSLGITGQPA